MDEKQVKQLTKACTWNGTRAQTQILGESARSHQRRTPPARAENNATRGGRCCCCTQAVLFAVKSWDSSQLVEQPPSCGTLTSLTVNYGSHRSRRHVSSATIDVPHVYISVVMLFSSHFSAAVLLFSCRSASGLAIMIVKSSTDSGKWNTKRLVGIIGEPAIAVTLERF